ncbi:MAG TPA: ABC transporter permease [Chloroflexota bacterium]|nr:ABC transporter permease [Chloroflexota bacterium]
MGRFIVRRLLQSVVLVFAVMTLSFVLINLTPGGPEAALIQNPRVSAETIQRMRQRFGLDDPLPVQYFKWMVAVAQGDLGRSYAYSLPVTEVIASRVWPTLQLGLMSYAFGLLGVPLGVYAASKRGALRDQAIRLLTVLGTAVPTWWLALSIIVFMSSTIGWFPNGQGSGSLGDWLKHIILPAILLGLGGLITFTRFVRSEVLEVLSSDYVRTARAKGLAEPVVQRAHVLRTALTPVITLLGSLLPAVLSGAVITETIFNWPGMGRLFIEAASARDRPLLLGMLLLGTVLTIIGTLLADIGYGLADPRVRYS